MPLPKDPIALTMTARNESMADVLLTYPVEFVDEDNVTMLSLGDGKTKIKVPAKCIDFLAVTMCQLEMFRRTTDILVDRPNIQVDDPDVQFYLALISYIASVITTFVHEVQEDGAKATESNWRSAVLDYHIALTLENSAFASTHQRIAEEKMNRTWADFRAKKDYKRIKSMTHNTLHKALCSDGDDSCGGPFVHKRSIDEVVNAAIVDIDAMRAAAASSSVAEPAEASSSATEPTAGSGSVTEPAVLDVAISQPTAINDWSGQPFEVCITKRPHIKATATKPGQASSTNSKKMAPCGVMSASSGPRHRLSQQTLDAESADELDHSEHAANVVERPEVRKKPVKARKTKKQAPLKKGKGKGKAPPKVLVVDSSDEIEISNLSSTDRTFPSEILSDHDIGGDDDPLPPTLPSASWRTDLADVIPNIRSGTRPNNRSDLSDGPLPSLLPEWDTWHRTAFERGNSQVFLKLATWMLLRFRQLTMTDMNADVNDVVIPLNPRTIPFEHDDDFLEALGMERLYAAIVHMETRPRYLSHLLHALGSLVNDADIGQSNHGWQPIASPPPVTPSMMEDVDVPWLYLSGSNRDVSHTSESTDVDAEDLPAASVSDGSVGASLKRKRTLSLASPPKKDGRRGPSKRSKQGSSIDNDDSPVNASDAPTDHETSGQPVGVIPEGHEVAVEPIGADPAGSADPVVAKGVPPTSTEIIITSEATGSSADVSVSILPASDVNNYIGMAGQDETHH
ncbi:hypothetical protein BDR03DRAFT_1017979 [Suillus americanus]|nr:hypothetical protein BDR03DRAFT_1017979 [Suillus americanus]